MNNYVSPDEYDLKDGIIAFENCWTDFINKVAEIWKKDGFSQDKINSSIDILALREIVERVAQRRDYFRRYHSGMEMSEYKEIGLYMFWIIKFHPFNIVNKEFDAEESFSINEDFAMFFMLSGLKNFAEKIGCQYDSDRLTNKLYNEILYSLCFRDISKEALGIIVELIANIVIVDLPKAKED